MKFFKMSAFLILVLLIQNTNSSVGFNLKSGEISPGKPKVVIGVVVDQMRWDFLYRYQERYTKGGFNRVLSEGFSYENTVINYAPTVTAAGHAAVFTGSVPAINGIAGNRWYDRELEQEIYCTEDQTVQVVGKPGTGSSHSPKNLLTTTLGDELKISNNFKSKVIGISLKDRGSILSAGHLADGAYWYDSGSGHFMTSTYYTDRLPQWMSSFNERELPEKYLQNPWETLFPLETYSQSTTDHKPYEKGIGGKEIAVFPYDYSDHSDDFGMIRGGSPYGNSLIFEAAKAAIEGEKLGSDKYTDLLAISFSTTDGIGHSTGPNSVEIEDLYLRLDREFEAFFEYLDNRFGKDEYLLFLTSDHGVAHSPGYLQEHNLPTGVFGIELIMHLNSAVEKKFGLQNLIVNASNYQLYLDQNIITESGLKREVLTDFIVSELKKKDAVVNAVASEHLAAASWPGEIKNRFINGYYEKRSGDIIVIFKPGWKEGDVSGASHGSWYPYDSHIPLLWMGWQIPRGETNRTVNITDIAPTVAALLKIQMPNGSIGEPLIEITDQKEIQTPK